MLNFLILSMIFSLAFMMMSHPLSITITLVAQSVMVSLITGSLNYDFWFSYIFFMIMVGGMMVVFIYMTSVASNEKFNFYKIWLLAPLVLGIPSMNHFLPMNTQDMVVSYNMKLNQISLLKFYSWPSSILVISLIIYLLITLIAVVKITKINQGPLRQTK